MTNTTASRSRPASTRQARSWCCARATSRPIPRRSSSSIAPAARAASSARSRSSMPACRTRWWRCATARWAGRSPGFEPDHGKERRAPRRPRPRRSPGRRRRRRKWRAASASSEPMARRVARWQADPSRTTYLFDVRDPAEYEAGHLPGAVSAPGGQLVQATDQYVGTLDARLVLADPLEVRALMTASWLNADGLARGLCPDRGGARDRPARAAHARPRRRAWRAASSADALAALMARGEATVLDLSQSRAFREGHIEGAWFAIRTRLAQALAAREAARAAGARVGGRHAGAARARRSRRAGARRDIPRRRHARVGRGGPDARRRRADHGGRAARFVAQGL